MEIAIKKKRKRLQDKKNYTRLRFEHIHIRCSLFNFKQHIPNVFVEEPNPAIKLKRVFYFDKSETSDGTLIKLYVSQSVIQSISQKSVRLSRRRKNRTDFLTARPRIFQLTSSTNIIGSVGGRTKR